MSSRVTNLILSILLFSLGLVCVIYYLKQDVTADGRNYFVLPKYVSPGFHLATLIGGLGMIVVSLFLILTSKKKSGCGHDHEVGAECEEDHEHGDMNPMVALCIICLPIGFSLSVTEHGFTEVELARRSELDLNPESFQQLDLPPFTLETLDDYKAKNANGAYEMQLMELFLTAGDPDVSKVLDGIKVQVEGAIRSQPGEEENLSVKRLYRMAMQCCAADMQAIPLKVYLDDTVAAASQVADHTWVKVEATLGFEVDKHGIKQAVLKVHLLEQATPPDTEVFQVGRRGSVLQDKL